MIPPRSGNEDENLEDALAYVRSAYAASREWYTTAETKAQLILGANGVFVTVIVGLLFGKLGDVRASLLVFGLDTWALLILSTVAIAGSICCAALTMKSLHGKATIEELRSLETHESESVTYRPEAFWYFGHLARIEPSLAISQLQKINGRHELEILSFHLVSLSRRVLRKYKFMNAGWAFLAAALLLTLLTGIDVVFRIVS